jgi:hypothetical protein
MINREDPAAWPNSRAFATQIPKPPEEAPSTKACRVRRNKSARFEVQSLREMSYSGLGLVSAGAAKGFKAHSCVEDELRSYFLAKIPSHFGSKFYKQPF